MIRPWIVGDDGVAKPHYGGDMGKDKKDLKNPFDRLRSANRARQPEYGDKGNGMVDGNFLGNAIAGETGELIEAGIALLTQLAISSGRMSNVIKKLERVRMGIKGSRVTKEDLEHEIADVMTYLDMIADLFDIKIWPVTVKKFNMVSDRLGFKTKLEE